MTLRTTSTGLLLAMFLFACGGKKEGAEKQPVTDQPNTPKTTAPETTAPKTTSASSGELKSLEADPGTGSGKALWTHKIGSMDKDSARAVAMDAQGNVAVAGYVSSEADFGDGANVKSDKTDAFVSVYGADGKLLWKAVFGGTGDDSSYGVTFGKDGEVIAVGLFADKMTVGESKVVAHGSDDVFIAKFDKAGTLVWLRNFGGPASDGGHDVVVRDNGNILLTGSFEGKVPIPDGTLESAGNEDIFVLELDANGDLVWVKSYGERVRDFGQHIALDPAGNAVVYGEYGGKVSFGGETLVSEGNQDLFLFKLDANGEHVWSRRFGGVFNELGLGLAVDPAGNIAITGSFDNEITFGGDSLKSEGESDIFVARFTPDGEYAWAKSFGGAREDIGYGLGADKYGNIVVGGWFWQSVDFGGGPLTAAGQNKDAFLLKLSATGEHIWSKRMGDKDHDQVQAVSVNADGRIAAAGIFRFSLDTGTGAVESSRKPDDLAPPPDAFITVFEP